MATTIVSVNYAAGIAGASPTGQQLTFPYGFFQVKDTTTGLVIGGSYPGNIILSAAGAPVNPATADLQQATLAAIQSLTTQLLGQSVILTNAFGNVTTPIVLDANS